MSIRLQLTDAHNGNYSYALTPGHLQALGATTLKGLEVSEPTAWESLQALSNYKQGAPANTAPGILAFDG